MRMFNFLKSRKGRNSRSIGGPQEEFKKSRKSLLRLSVVSIAVTFLALAIVGLKILYPFHMIIGLSVYVLSFVPIARRIYLSRKAWQKYRSYEFSRTFFRKERHRLMFAFIFIMGSILFLWVRPLDEKPFAAYSNTQIQELIVDDLYQSVSAMDYLETTGNALVVTLVDTKDDSNSTKEITNLFNDFLRAVSFSESLTDKHRYFASIPYSLWNERVDSFLISYSLYVKKYEIVHRIMSTVSGSEYKKKVLNQYIPYASRGNVYDEMVVRFYTPKTRLRLSGGALYMFAFVRPNENRVDAHELLYGKASESYKYLFEHFFSTIAHTGEVLLDRTERKMFDSWFPIQKTVANSMGRIILTTRGKDGFITPVQAAEMGHSMQPGDIMLQRRNWHLSNVGIPGFWTHSAVYTGDLAEMDRYFAAEFPYGGYNTISSLLKAKYPKVYELYKMNDTDGYPPSVIEAIEPGVVIRSLPVSADADFVVVLRPRLLNKHDGLRALLEAFENVGKPYDYNFDFDTRDAFVCSELVFDAYFENLPEKHGLHFTTSLVNGRKIVSPLDMANKFIQERGTTMAELSFVYFLRGNEATQSASVGSEDEFIKSVSWSKFSFFQK